MSAKVKRDKEKEISKETRRAEKMPGFRPCVRVLLNRSFLRQVGYGELNGILRRALAHCMSQRGCVGHVVHIPEVLGFLVPCQLVPHLAGLVQLA